MDSRIALLIANRTSIQEIDRQIKKKKSTEASVSSDASTDFSTNKQLMAHYSNLFYALQVEPKYLAKIAYLIPGDKTDAFIELLLLILYGDAYSPREEYLILQLFKYAMEVEISHSTDPKSFTQSDTVVPKMVLTYNKRKQGVEYIKNTLTSFVKEMMGKDYQFELSALTIYNKLQNDQDVRSGGKKTKPHEVTAQTAAQDPQVKAIIQQRTKELEGVANSVLERTLNTMKSLPYGLRLICKQIRTLIMAKFPKVKPDEVWQVIGYYVYYRFIGLALVSPDSFEIGDRNLSINTRRNLGFLSKVLLQVFVLMPFSNADDMHPLNPWIAAQKKRVIEYYSELVDVPQPEDQLQVNQYMELTQKTKPLIIISLAEICLAHHLVKESINHVVPDPNDPVRIILADLGEVPQVDVATGKKAVQMQLENRFKGTMDNEIAPGAAKYAETKELIIQIFKAVPSKVGPQTLSSILKDASELAKSSSNKVLQGQVTKVLANLAELEDLGLVTQKDKYTSLLKDVALEVANRAERREAQQKEISRLRATVKNLGKHGEFMSNQISEFERYLESCRKNSLARAKVKAKPVKFTFKELSKRRVILSTTVSDVFISRAKFFISMPQIGKFHIEAKLQGMSAATVTLDLDDLLEKKENHDNCLELDQISLSVPDTILLINKTFLG